jgi:hypothetical protein
LSGTNSLVFERVGSSTNVTIEWSVVEFLSGVSVQRGSEPLNAPTKNVTISSVDLTKSFPLATLRIGGTVTSDDDFIRSRLTSATNLELAAFNDRADAVVEWQVIEYADASVQTGDLSFLSTEATKIATVPVAVDTSKAWLIYSYRTQVGTTSDTGQKLVRGLMTGPTSLQFDRDRTGQAIDVSWQLVEFTDATTVQHANAAFTSAELQKDVPITAVDSSRSIAVGGYEMRGGKSPYGSNDHTGVAWFTTQLTNDTNLRIRRDVTQSSTADLGWFVVDFGQPTWSVSGTVYDDINDNGSFDASELGIGTGWAKLISGGVVIQVAEADPDSGAYSFTNVADGSYTVIVDDNNNVADTTPTEPLNWLFRNPGTGSLAVTVSGSDEADQDFGLTYDFDLAADCVCGYQDGLFTQRVIAIDGDMTDWGPVLSDPDNNACDATDDTDRDHPVQSTGRNLLRTAVTWDATYFSMWTQRVGSSSNTQNFIYYADTNVDGIMSAGEPVVVAKWQGSNGNVTLELYGYDDLGSGGDPLLDGSGFVDGYNMPGDLTFVKTLTPPDGSGQGATAGAIAGTQMEWKIEWSELGVPTGAAISWHVSSTNANPGASGLGAQVDDNLGGCGAQCAGTNQFGGVAADPISGGGGQIVHSSVVFTNTGNGPDLFDFEWTSSGAWVPVSVSFYRDLGTVGQFDPGVDTLITDTDGDTLPDTGNLLAGESFDLLTAIELPGPPAVGSATFTVTGTSNFVPGCGATVTPAKGSVDELLYIPGVGYLRPGRVRRAQRQLVLRHHHSRLRHRCLRRSRTDQRRHQHHRGSQQRRGSHLHRRCADPGYRKRHDRQHRHRRRRQRDRHRYRQQRRPRQRHRSARPAGDRQACLPARRHRHSEWDRHADRCALPLPALREQRQRGGERYQHPGRAGPGLHLRAGHDALRHRRCLRRARLHTGRGRRDLRHSRRRHCRHGCRRSRRGELRRRHHRRRRSERRQRPARYPRQHRLGTRFHREVAVKRPTRTVSAIQFNVLIESEFVGL